jgi:hypothetical protein
MNPLAPFSDVSLGAYVRARQVELAKSLRRRGAIYLDIKFWIILRDVVMGLRTAPAEQELLSLLREGVAEGSIFCPISDTTFSELLKKADVESRRLAAALIDELSIGVTLIPYHMRAGTEIAHLLHSARNPNDVHPLEDLVWSKLSYVMGFLHPHGTPFDPATELAMQKDFFDHMWNMGMCQMIDAIGDHPLPVQPFDVLARQINELNAQHMEELRTFSQAYDCEMHGMLDIFINVAADVVEQMVISKYGPRAPLAPDQRKEEERQLHNLLFASLKKERTKKALPTLDILATLNASIRWNKKQQLKPNDFLDFQHATAALGYCDAFFTERSLRGQITASHVRLDEKYGCKVIATPEDAVAYLRDLKEESMESR